MRIISAAEAIREGTAQLLKESNSVIVIGEGVPDAKACFGTTRGLKEQFPDQVFDMPISENGGTGVCIGASLAGLRPIMVHMRCDFLLYAADQIVNNAAKWWSMFGGMGGSCPIVIRAFIGRGWGAGQQHSQNLEAMFAHIPGLKVVVPSNAFNAKGLLISAVKDANPVIMLEHRWIHQMTSHVPEDMYAVEIGRANVARLGFDVTVVVWGHMVKEALMAAGLAEAIGVSVEVIDMLSLRPMDTQEVINSVDKTGRLIVACEDWSFGNLGGEIIASVAESGVEFKEAPLRISNPDYCVPSSPHLTRPYYATHLDIAWACANLMNKKINLDKAREEFNSKPHDVPDQSFVGPF